MRPRSVGNGSSIGMGALVLLSLLAAPPLGRDAAAQSCEYPAVLLVVDRSSSMWTGSIDGVRKWEIAREAILEMVDRFREGIRFGLMIYPGPSGTGSNGIEGTVPACAISPPDCTPERPKCTTGEVVVEIGPGAPEQIQAILQTPPPRSGAYTPTWQSLEAADRYRPLHDPARRNFVILITDGWQCCGVNDQNQCASFASERLIMVDKVAQLAEHGVTTYVIGFGATNGAVDALALNRSAEAGGTARPGCDPDSSEPSCYSMASNHDELAGFLQGIARQISEEICDNKDNDCDGELNEGLTRPCSTPCGEGMESCDRNGQWTRCNVPDPAPEECNGVDDDCDGQLDEQLSRACNNACGRGEERCENGRWVGCTAPAPQPEACNGRDDDCDGTIDEGCACQDGQSEACGIGVGECRRGRRTCVGGRWGDCEGGQGPQAEACDGKDNDCDGEVDSFTRDCATICGNGTEICLNGQWRGCNAPLPSPEDAENDCDGRDNDCDGRIDEDLVRPCNNGCPNEEGTQVCIGPGQWSECNALRPMDEEICGDGMDNDCNGLIDDGCTCDDGDTQPCGSDRGECQQGVQTCTRGQWGECHGGRREQEERCDGKDNDCDGVTDEMSDEPCSNDCGEGVRRCEDGEPGECSVPDPPEEVCDGLDNDCDGLQDEGDLCDADLRCFCGACTGRCVQGECEAGARCIDGFCIADHCPAGYHCEGTTCVPGDGGGGEGTGPGDGEGDGDDDGRGGKGGGGGSVEDGCGCRTVSPLTEAAQALPLLLVFAGLLLAIRRR
ncbi:MAG: VWA domain-containing protein [Deltaproteobacteria bacterium]|nr:VWA domain-containing protein [Deltaproteobacteria bacterium]